MKKPRSKKILCKCTLKLYYTVFAFDIINLFTKLCLSTNTCNCTVNFWKVTDECVIVKLKLWILYIHRRTHCKVMSRPPHPSRRNWFCKSQLMSIVAIDLWKSYANRKAGESCTCIMFTGLRILDEVFLLQDQNTWNTFPRSEQWTIIKQ
jgi:hypothetical protein